MQEVLASRADWAIKISEAWQKSLDGVLEVGRLLLHAKDALAHGEYLAMVESDLPFGERTARRLTAVARDPRLTNRTHVSVLPTSWGTLYELTRLSDEEFFDAVDRRLIHPEMERADVKRLFSAKKVEGAEDEDSKVVSLGCSAKSLDELIANGRTFGTIYADPPWKYDNQGTRGSTDKHYSTMTVEELCDMPVEKLAAPDAHLHLWTTNAFLFRCEEIFQAWGFEFKSSFVWVKPQIGMGNYWRNSHEFLLTGVKGNAKFFNDRNLKSWAEFPRTQHSTKPSEIHRLLERSSPGPRLELFARRMTPGWTVWGNEIEENLFNQQFEAVAV